MSGGKPSPPSTHASVFASNSLPGRDFLVRLLAIKRLRVEEKLNLAKIKKRLDAMTPAELEAFATQGIQPGPLATALGIVPPPPPAPAEGWPLSPRAESMRQRWSRVEIVDGLEVLVRDIEHCVGGLKA